MVLEDILLSYFDGQSAGTRCRLALPGSSLGEGRQDTLMELMAAQNLLEGFRHQLSERLAMAPQPPAKSLQLTGLLVILMRVLDELRAEINHFTDDPDYD